LKNVLSKIHNKIEEKEFHQLENFISKGILVDDIFIFGKQGGASVCPKCTKNKIRYTALDDKLRVRVPKIWKHLHLDSLNDVLFDSTIPNLKINSIYDKFDLVPNETFTDYRLISGAEEIEVEITGDVHSKESQFIRVDAESYSTQKNVINSILSKKFYTFKAK
jgi:hypothetical protein